MSQNGFRNEVYPAIYSGYPSLLDGIYSGWRLDTSAERLSYLRNLQGPATELWEEFQKQDVSPDYSRPGYEDAYLLRYFFPYSLLVPSVLHYHLSDFFHTDGDLLIASFLGCGPGPELYGLMYYLRYARSGVPMISASMLDIAPNSWAYSRNIVSENLLNRTWDSGLYEISEFKSNLAGASQQFLSNDTERWLEESNLIVIQNCLNEIPVSGYDQVLVNMTRMMDIMKPSALILIIERHGYPMVKKLLGNIRSTAKKFDNMQTRHRPTGDSRYIKTCLNPNCTPKDLRTHLFSQIELAKQVKYHWLAISKC